jgi:two-component system, sensor histidine kinase
MVIGDTGRPSTPEAERRQIFGGLGGALILTALAVVAALPVAPWPAVAGWAAVTLAAAWLEERQVRREAASGLPPGWKALAFTLATSILHAAAAFALIVWGDAAARLFSFALLAVCMVHVLLRRYQAPWIFLAGLAPHVGVIGLVAFGLTTQALDRGEHLAAATPVAVLGLFAALFWAARAQLADAWSALSRAKVEAQERERAADAANQAKSQFLATMSHEIRTPLNGVLGMAQAMTADELNDAQRSRLKVIRRSGETLLAVLDDVLDLSKIEASRLELEIVEFDMGHMVRGVAAAYAPLAERKGVSFELEIDEPATGAYRGDPTRLRRILYNLVSNAVKFTEAGAIRVAIRRTDGGVAFQVSDTGVGVAPEARDHLFEAFYQADRSATRRFGGSGLGLAICHQLAELMGGVVEVESVVDEGSTFTLTVPLPRIGDAMAPAAPPVAPTPAEATDIRVLAAEDNDINQLVLKTLLLQAGVEPVIVANGALAVQAWEEAEWDVILMDIQMPEMDGPAATRAIRARELETGRRRTPIVALTANAMAHQRAEYDAAGMDDLVAKPIEIARLFEALDRALSGEPEQQDAAVAG